jgi:hypothetical protein
MMKAFCEGIRGSDLGQSGRRHDATKARRDEGT